MAENEKTGAGIVSKVFVSEGETAYVDDECKMPEDIGFESVAYSEVINKTIE